jgi:hypothetical protein
VLLAGLAQTVQLVVGQVLGQPVALVVGEPELARLGVEVEAHGVAHAARHDLHPAPVEVDAADVRVVLRGRLADVAGRAHRHVELAVRPDLDELPAVGDDAGQLVVDEDTLLRLVQRVLDVVVARDGLGGRHVERPLVELDKGGKREVKTLAEKLMLPNGIEVIAVLPGPRVGSNVNATELPLDTAARLSSSRKGAASRFAPGGCPSFPAPAGNQTRWW